MITWSSTILAPAEAGSVIPVQRVIAAPRLPEGVEEPTKQFDPQGLVAKLSSAVADARQQQQQGQRSVLDEDDKAISSAANDVMRQSRHLTKENKQLVKAEMLKVRALVTANVPVFQQQHPQAKKTWERQPTDRKQRPLCRGRRKQRASQQPVQSALHAVRRKRLKVAGRFKRQQEAGRPRSTFRGMGSMVRGPGKGGRRPPRSNPHLAAPAPAAGQQQGRLAQHSQRQHTGASASQQPSQQQLGSQAAAQRPDRPRRAAAAAQQELMGHLLQGGLVDSGAEEQQLKKKQRHIPK